ncbi:hypothetical protein V8B97DRAFT_2026893 [Scleroderma yunnanense]
MTFPLLKLYSTTLTPHPLCSARKSQLLCHPTSHPGLLTVNDPDFSNAYQHCLDEGWALPPDMKWPLLDGQGIKIVQSRMEAILECQATVIDDHFKICFAANTLLLLQHTILIHLPSHEACEINEKLNKLWLEHRHVKFGTQPNISDVAPRLLPMFERPQLGISVIGRQFHLVKGDVVYCIHSIHASLDGYMFSIHDPDIVSNNELDFMLQHSVVVD